MIHSVLPLVIIYHLNVLRCGRWKWITKIPIITCCGVRTMGGDEGGFILFNLESLVIIIDQGQTVYVESFLSSSLRNKILTQFVAAWKDSGLVLTAICGGRSEDQKISPRTTSDTGDNNLFCAAVFLMECQSLCRRHS